MHSKNLIIMQQALRLFGRIVLFAFLLGLSSSFLPDIINFIVEKRVEIEVEKRLQNFREESLEKDSVIDQQNKIFNLQEGRILEAEDNYHDASRKMKEISEYANELRNELSRTKRQLEDSTQSLSFLREHFGVVKEKLDQSNQIIFRQQKKEAELTSLNNKLSGEIGELSARVELLRKKANQYDLVKRHLQLYQIGISGISLLLGIIILMLKMRGWKLVNGNELTASKEERETRIFYSKPMEDIAETK